MQGVELAIPAIDQVLAASFSPHLDHKALPEEKRHDTKKVFTRLQIIDQWDFPLMFILTEQNYS